MSKDKEQDFNEVLDLFDKLHNPTLKGTLTFTYAFELLIRAGGLIVVKNRLKL